MAALDRKKFADECLKQGLIFGALAHFMLAVAQLRSKITDDKNGDLIGPFQLKQDQWDKQRVDPRLKFEATDISDWQKQCALFACWNHKVHSALATANGVDPTAEDLYQFQFPGAAVDKLDQALTDTKDLMPTQVASAVTGLAAEHPSVA